MRFVWKHIETHAKKSLFLQQMSMKYIIIDILKQVLFSTVGDSLENKLVY